MSSDEDYDGIPNPLAAFWVFVRHIKSLKSYVVVGAAALPLVDLLIRCGPNWPNRETVALGTMLVELIAYMVSFQLWNDLALKRLNRRWIICISFIPVFASVYFYLFGMFVHAPLGWANRVIGARDLDVLADTQSGIEMRRVAEISYSVDDALADSGNDPDKIWERNALMVTRLALTGTWMALFCMVSLVLATFVILQMKNARKRVNQSGK